MRRWALPWWIPLLALPGCAPQGVENLVLITVDTLRADHVGAYADVASTPVLDQLAEEGVVVEGACTPTPTTAPAHVSLLSGLHPWRHGVLFNGMSLDGAELPTVASLARDAGLRTAAFVSSYVLHPRWGYGEGFERYRFVNSRQGESEGIFERRAEATTRAALQWLREFGEERFLLWIHYYDPHAPYEPPPLYLEVAPPEAALPDATRAAWDGEPDELLRQRRAYRGEVAYVDAQIGRVVDALDELGLAETTALVVTADHGEGLGDHGLLRHGRNLFDELVLVPLIVRAPSIPAGRRVRGPAQLEDLMPTLLALLGLSAPRGIDGLDLLPWLRGEVERSPRRSVLGQRRYYAGEPFLFFERRWPEKWIGELEGEGTRYRLDEDPDEQRGRGEAEAPSALRAAKSHGLPPPQPERTLDAEARRALGALGYLDEP